MLIFQLTCFKTQWESCAPSQNTMEQRSLEKLQQMLSVERATKLQGIWDGAGQTILLSFKC